MQVLGVFTQVGTIKQEMRNVRKVQNTVLSNLKPDDLRHQKVPLLWELSNSPHRLHLAPADAVENSVITTLFWLYFQGKKRSEWLK